RSEAVRRDLARRRRIKRDELLKGYGLEPRKVPQHLRDAADAAAQNVLICDRLFARVEELGGIITTANRRRDLHRAYVEADARRGRALEDLDSLVAAYRDTQGSKAAVSRPRPTSEQAAARLAKLYHDAFISCPSEFVEALAAQGITVSLPRSLIVANPWPGTAASPMPEPV